MNETLSFALRIAKTIFTRTKVPKFSGEAFLAAFLQLPGTPNSLQSREDPTFARRLMHRRHWSG